VVLFPDGSALVEPSLREMAEKVGMQTQAASRHYEIVIIGAGPAGLAAAVYGGSEGHNVLLIERHAPGGQAGNSPKIEITSDFRPDSQGWTWLAEQSRRPSALGPRSYQQAKW